MDEKTRKFLMLFRQKSLLQLLSQSQSAERLCGLLTEEEVDVLLGQNVIFIRSASPSSKIELSDIEVNGSMILINFETNLMKFLLPDEIIAILLHEIGHVFNPNLTGIEGEFAADNFAKEKGFARWIISGLEKGLKNNWLGFDEQECRPRIDRLKEGKHYGNNK